MPAQVHDVQKAARQARLHYSSDDQPGIRRQRRGRGWIYLNSRGQVIHHAATLGRIKALAIPPAWTNVWIAPDPADHLQATGRDAKERKQYRYHARWREWRDNNK